MTNNVKEAQRVDGSFDYQKGAVYHRIVTAGWSIERLVAEVEELLA